MKMKILSLSIVISIFYSTTWAQTSYGNLNEGNAGNNGGNTASYFGYLAGNSNTGAGTTFIGYLSGFDNTTGQFNTAVGSEALTNNTTGTYNTATGRQALVSNTTGSSNMANGHWALRFNTTGGSNTAAGNSALHDNTTGSYNTATGRHALYNNDIGSSNTANGYRALYNNEGGNHNTANGHRALHNNDTGSHNTAVGESALHSNTIGVYNTATGSESLHSNTTGGNNTAIGGRALYSQSYSNGGAGWYSNNVAIGYEALYSNQPTGTFNGIRNTAVGTRALYSNTTGYYNVANGYQALYNNDSGNSNTATGFQTLFNNEDGILNTASGTNALLSNIGGIGNTASGADALQSNTEGILNTAVGYGALEYNETGSYNTAIGYDAGPASGDVALENTTALGRGATPTASNQVRIGNSSVTSIGGHASWTTLPSDGRFKVNVEENIAGLDFINKLRPVSYNVDLAKIRSTLENSDSGTQEPSMSEKHVGFIAQEVAQVITENGYIFSGVDVPEEEESGQYGIRYAEFVIPLTKAVQELSALVEAQQQENNILKERIESLENVIANTDKETGNLQSKGITHSIEGFALHQNTPNPFNQTTTINAVVPETVQQAKIIVYNLQGLELESYALNHRGNISVEISGGSLPAGIYLYSLMADGMLIDTKKMVLR